MLSYSKIEPKHMEEIVKKRDCGTNYNKNKQYYMCNFNTGGKEKRCTFVGTYSEISEHFCIHTGVFLYHCWACESYFSERRNLIKHLSIKRCDIRDSYLIENKYEDERFHMMARDVYIKAIPKEEHDEKKRNPQKKDEFAPSYSDMVPPYKTSKRAHYPDFVRRSQLRSRSTDLAQAVTLSRHREKELAEHRSVYQDQQPMDTSPIEQDSPEHGLQPPDYHPANRNVSTGSVSSEQTVQLDFIQHNLHHSQSVTWNQSVIEEVSLAVHLDKSATRFQIPQAPTAQNQNSSQEPFEQATLINNGITSQAQNQDCVSNSNEIGPELREIVKKLVREEVDQIIKKVHDQDKSLVEDRPPPNATSVQPVSVVTPPPARSVQPNPTTIQQYSDEHLVSAQNIAQIPLPTPNPVQQQPAQNHQNTHLTQPPLIYSQDPIPASQQQATGHLTPFHPLRIMERAQQLQYTQPASVGSSLPNVARLPVSAQSHQNFHSTQPPAPLPANSFVPVQPVPVELPLTPQNVAKPVPQQSAQNHQNPHSTDLPIYSQSPIPVSQEPATTVRSPAPAAAPLPRAPAPPPTNSSVAVQPVSAMIPPPAQSVQPNQTSVQQNSSELPVSAQRIAQITLPAPKPVPQPPAQNNQTSHSTQPPASPPTNSAISCSTNQSAIAFNPCAPPSTTFHVPPPPETVEEIPLPQSPQRFSPRPFSPIPVRPFSPSLYYVPLDLLSQVPAPTSPPSSDHSTQQAQSPPPIQSPQYSSEDDATDSVDEEIAESFKRASRKRNRSYGSYDDDPRDPTWSPSQERPQRSRSRSERTSGRERSKSRQDYEHDPPYIPREGESQIPRKVHRTRSNPRHGERVVGRFVRQPTPEVMDQIDLLTEPDQVYGLLGSRENPVVLSDDEESIRDSSPDTNIVHEHDEDQLGSREMSIDSRSGESSPEPEQDPVRSSREHSVDSELSVCPETPQASPKPWLDRYSRPSPLPPPPSQRSDRPARNLHIESGGTAHAYNSNTYRQGLMQTNPQDYLQMN